MRSLQVSKRQTFHTGFTLVEMLVVAPIAILSIGIIVSVTISMVGDAMISQARATTAYTTQDALDRIEKDIRLSSAFLSSFSAVQPGQGKNATSTLMTDTTSFSTSSNTTSDTLILNSPATTSDPYDSSRALVYYKDQPNACGGATTNLNRPLTVRIIYFLRTQNSVTTLWRRTVVPVWNTSATVDANTVCNAPWQRDSCPIISGSDCQANDEKMIDNVSAFTLTYYTASGATTTDSRLAVSTKVMLSTSRPVAGAMVNNSAVLRATRTNDSVDPTPSPPSVAVLNPNINIYNHPLKRTFGWAPVAYATQYKVRYRTNSGPWINTINSSTQISIASRPLDIIDIGVIAVGSMGESSETLLTGQQVPLWTVINLENSWVCFDLYETTYRCPSYTVLSSDVVVVSGMAKNGMVDSTIFTMPPEMRPKKTYAFPSQVNTSRQARIDIQSDGAVKYMGSNSPSRISFDDLRYLRGSTPVTWNTPSLTNGWGNWSNGASGYGNLEYAIDSMNRVHMNGVISTSTSASFNDGTVIHSFGTGYYERGGQGISPGVSGISPSISPYAFQISSSLSATAKGVGPINSQVVNRAFYPSVSNTDTATTPAVWSGTNCGGGFAVATYSKASDGLVMLQGCVLPDTVTIGTVIFTLPSDKRPKKRLVFSAADSGMDSNPISLTTTRIDIYPNGNVTLQNKLTPYLWTSLDGISFIAE